MTKRPTLTLRGSEKKTIESADNTESAKNIETSDQAETKSRAKVKTDAGRKPQDKANSEVASSKILNNGRSAVGKTKSSTHTPNTGASATAFSRKTNKHFISDEDYKTILKYMQEHYPKCFPASYNDIVPIAIGIHKELFDIPDLPFARITIRRFLTRYVKQKAYRAKLIVGSDRIGLNGSPTSKVLESEVNREEWQKVNAARPKVDKASHDLLIKKALENPAIAQEFLELYLPQEYKELIDLNTVNPEKESYVEDSLKSKLSDMVFSVQLKADRTKGSTQQQNKNNSDQGDQETDKNSSAFIYCMIEHQSSSDYWIALRLLKYSLLLLERYAVKRNQLPIILPMVLYNGKKAYSAPRNIFELFSHPEIARKSITEDYRLVDLQATLDDNIDYDRHLSFLLYVMKHIHDRDMLLMLKNAMERCNKAIIIDQKQNYVLTRLILWYTDSKVALEKKQALEQLIMDNLPKEDRGNIMKTIAQSYIDEGYDKGIQEGKSIGIQEGIEKAVLNMLSQNLAPELIAQYTGSTVEQIKKLKESGSSKQ